MDQLIAEKRRRVVIEKRREAIAAYLASEDLEAHHIETLLKLIDLYGLLHRAYPKPGPTARQIRPQAEAAARKAWKKTWRILKAVAPHARQARSDAAANLG